MCARATHRRYYNAIHDALSSYAESLKYLWSTLVDARARASAVPDSELHAYCTVRQLGRPISIALLWFFFREGPVIKSEMGGGIRTHRKAREN
jgi:hypothetical protein